MRLLTFQSSLARLRTTHVALFHLRISIKDTGLANDEYLLQATVL
jgi:hypothetical protein